MENNKNKRSVKFQGDMLNFCDFIQVFVFTRNHHLKANAVSGHISSYCAFRGTSNACGMDEDTKKCSASGCCC